MFFFKQDNPYSYSYLDRPRIVIFLLDLVLSLRVALWELWKARAISKKMGLDDLGVKVTERGIVQSHEGYFDPKEEQYFHCPAIVRLARGAGGRKIAWCWRCREILDYFDAEPAPTTVDEFLKGL